jgi:ribosome maturation factor RimP
VTWLDAVERTVTALGYDLVETERVGRGLLRVYIDRLPNAAYDTGPGEFVLVEDCEKVTRQLQHVLEVDGCDYERLEVSSPGLDRPLKRPADYARFCGEAINLTLRHPFEGQKKFSGVLEALPAFTGVSQLAAAADAATTAPAEWRLVLTEVPAARKPGDKPANPASKSAAKKAAQSDAKTQRALDFALSEVREARLVPVVDFKGQRFMPAPNTALAPTPVAEDQEDGGREE